jgi:hypothetical protein
MTEPGWISLKCSWCQTKFRIKEAYAHLKGKCPECGTRVPAVKTKPHEPLPAFSDADEPMGLVPLDDDEWPEPAQRELDHGEVAGLQYGFAAMTPPAKTIEPTTPAPGTVFTLAAEKPAAPAPPPAPTSQASEDTFQPALPKKEKPAPAPPRKEPAPPAPPVKPPQAKPVDPLFLDETPAMAAEPPPPLPPPPKPVPATAAPQGDVLTLADVQKAQQPPDDAPVISPYSFKDGAPAPLPPAPPPLAKFAPADNAPPPDGEKEAKPKRKKEKAVATDKNDKTDPQASSNEPTKDADAYRLSQAELNPERAVPPPDQLFIFGVWDWPFHPVNLKALIGTAVGTMLFLFFLSQSIDQYTGENKTLGFVFGSALAFMALVIFGLFGSYASAWFLGIVNDTANGSREVIFPGGGIVEWLAALLRVVWIALLATLITMPLGAIWAPLWGLGALMLFPVFLLCSLASDWSMSPWHPDVAWNIARKIKLFLTMNFLAALLWALVATVIWATAGSKWLLCPLGGLAFGIVWLIYARLLGRFGWVVLNPDEEQERKKKKKKKKKKDESDSEEESPSADGTSSSLVVADKP